MVYAPELKLWFSEYEKTEFRIEWIFFEEDCELHPLIQTMPHVGFIVEDLDQAIRRRTILLEPFLYEGFKIVFIEDQGVPVEFLQLSI